MGKSNRQGHTHPRSWTNEKNASQGGAGETGSGMGQSEKSARTPSTTCPDVVEFGCGSAIGLTGGTWEANRLFSEDPRTSGIGLVRSGDLTDCAPLAPVRNTI